MSREQWEKARPRIIEWTKSIFFALVLAFVLRATVVQSREVPTGSMEPTIMPGDRILASKIPYVFHEPGPGDIVTFTPPERVPGRTRNFLGMVIPFVKRVIAAEGDVVEVVHGRVYRNGVPLAEPYLNCPPNYRLPPLLVPDGEFFVLGDNRCNSFDSHAWGFLPREGVRGKVVFRYWPPKRIGFVR